MSQHYWLSYRDIRPNHSTPCFPSPLLYRRVARPFSVVVLWCCRLTDQVCSALNVPPGFGRLLLDYDSPHPPIDCLHGPPSPYLSLPSLPIIHRFRIKRGCQALPFRTVVFSAAIAFLCPDALRSNNRSIPFMRCRSWVLPSSKYSLPHDRQPPRIQPPRFGGAKGKLKLYQPRFRTTIVECEPPWPPGRASPEGLVCRYW